MINTQTEQLLSLPEAACAVPSIGGKKPHTSTLFRWTRDGVRGGVKLETVRIGRRICTTREALERFFHEVSHAPAPAPEPQRNQPKARTEAQRKHDVSAARKRLAAAGIGGVKDAS